MRMRRQDRQKHLTEHLTARVERPELDAAIVRDDLQGRAGGSDIPAGITARIFVSGGEIDAAVTVQLAQDMKQPFAIADLRHRTADSNAVGGCVAKFAHVTTW